MTCLADGAGVSIASDANDGGGSIDRRRMLCAGAANGSLHFFTVSNAPRTGPDAAKGPTAALAGAAIALPATTQ